MGEHIRSFYSGVIMGVFFGLVLGMSITGLYNFFKYEIYRTHYFWYPVAFILGTLVGMALEIENKNSK